MRILFEEVSALGTVGLSLNLTPELSAEGKGIIIVNMFAGRVGLLSLLMAVQSLQPRKAYTVAETPVSYTHLDVYKRQAFTLLQS